MARTLRLSAGGAKPEVISLLPLPLAPQGMTRYRPPILKGLAAAGFPAGCLFSFRAKTGGANRLACENHAKETDLNVR
jgi:hypothetical protein